MTDTTPEAAERLAEALEQLDAFAEDFLKADRPFTADIMRSIATLIRAQAAEIEGLRGQITAIVDAYNRAMPMRSADWHGADCYCLRCGIDNASADLAAAPAPQPDAAEPAGWTHKREEG